MESVPASSVEENAEVPHRESPPSNADEALDEDCLYSDDEEDEGITH